MRAGSLLWHGRRGFCNDKIIQDGYSTAPSAAPLRRAPETISYARFTSRPEGVPSLGPAGHRRDGVQKPADSQPQATPQLEILILPERMRGGRSGLCPVLRQRSKVSMVPGYVQGGTRAGPVKCRVERGADGFFGYGEYLFCASARAGSSARAGCKSRLAKVAYAGSEVPGKATAERRQNLLLAAGQSGHATGMQSKG
jgi:hypothetical protein